MNTYLQTKIKNKELNPEQEWITTYNDYLHRLKHFFRWIYNRSGKVSTDEWSTPNFVQSIKPKKTRRLSPYSESEIWAENNNEDGKGATVSFSLPLINDTIINSYFYLVYVNRKFGYLTLEQEITNSQVTKDPDMIG